MNNEFVFMRPINWLNHRKVPYVNVEIVINFYNAYCTPKYIFFEKYFDSWDPKIHSPRNYLQGFYVATIIVKWGTENKYPLVMFQNGTKKKKIICYRQDELWNYFVIL